MIRWCVEQGFITIPKSEKETRILENSQVFDFSLSAQDMEAIVSTPRLYCFLFHFPSTSISNFLY